MASLIDNLFSVIDSQKNCLDELLILSRAKKDLIVKNDIENLGKITAAESSIVAKNTKLDKAREEITVDIATVLAENAKELTLTKIITLINDEKDKERLLKLKEEVEDILKNLKTQNEQNNELIQVSLDNIEFSMNVIREVGDKQEPRRIIDTIN